MSYLLSALTADEVDAALAAAHRQPAPRRAAGRPRLHARRRRARPRPRRRCGSCSTWPGGRTRGRSPAPSWATGWRRRASSRRPRSRSSPRPRRSCWPGKEKTDDTWRSASPPWRPVARSCCGSPTLAEDLGYTAFTVAEGWGYDAGVLLAEIATRTSRIELGTGRAQRVGAQPGEHRDAGVGPRTPCPAAGSPSASARAARSSPRACTTSPFRAPVRRLGATARQVRALLDGERAVTSTGGRGLRLAAPAPVPLHLAALGPAAVRLAGEVADAWVPFLQPRSGLKERHVPAGGRRRAGRAPAAAGRAGHPDGAVAGGGRVVGGVLPDQHGPAVRDHRCASRASGRRWTRWSRPTGAACRRPSRPPRRCWSTSCCSPSATDLDRWCAAGADLPALVLPPGRPLDELESHPAPRSRP